MGVLHAWHQRSNFHSHYRAMRAAVKLHNNYELCYSIEKLYVCVYAKITSRLDNRPAKHKTCLLHIDSLHHTSSSHLLMLNVHVLMLQQLLNMRLLQGVQHRSRIEQGQFRRQTTGQVVTGHRGWLHRRIECQLLHTHTHAYTYIYTYMYIVILLCTRKKKIAHGNT